MVVAVGGPPHSGKSVFLAELYRQLLTRRPSGVFLQRACPDGEGMWSAESDPAVVKEIRRKGNFDNGFMTFTLQSIEALGARFPITLVDRGGRRSAQNAEILARSSHVIILSSNQDENEPWSQFAAEEGAKTLAVLGSRLIKREDGSLDSNVRSVVDTYSTTCEGATPRETVTGEMLNLDREGSKEPYKGAISDLADWLIERADDESAQ